jgi:polyisoprenoid-binding protein YceI
VTAELQAEKGIVRIPKGEWRVDPTHSSVEFEIKHMMIATVRGRFREFEGTLLAGETLAESRARGIVKVASIDTNNDDRDAHLRSADFFDAERYPEITFDSSRVESRGGPDFRVTGELTIRDVTREIQLDATVEGVQRDPWGHERAGLRVRGSLNRNDFGLRWQKALESGGFLLGDEVRLLVEVSAVRAS